MENVVFKTQHYHYFPKYLNSFSVRTIIVHFINHCNFSKGNLQIIFEFIVLNNSMVI